MKKLFFVLLLVMWLFIVHGQEVKAPSVPFSYLTEQLAVGKAVLTTKYVVIKNVKHFLYRTERGSHYYILMSKDKWVRRYVKNI